jgi:hypothetical protein
VAGEDDVVAVVKVNRLVAVHRYANNRLLRVLDGPNASPDGQLIPFLCECADEKCWDSVRITKLALILSAVFLVHLG